MASPNHFLSEIYVILKEELKSLGLTEVEELNIKSSIYYIFEQHNDLEMIFYELLDYLDDNERLHGLIPKIEKQYESLIIT